MLVNPSGFVEQLMAGTLDESMTVIKNAYKGWSVTENAFPAEIKNRNLADKEILPHFPYRDDGLLLWEAIEQFVTQYVRLYYRRQVDVQDDKELQAWAGELASHQFGRVRDMPAKIDSKQQLIELITTLIFTSGPQHGAVNFSQYDYMGFVPNMPLAAYCPVPGQSPLEATLDPKEQEKKLMEFLPPKEEAYGQVQVMETLSTYHYDTLGFYESDAFIDPKAIEIIEAFQKSLAQIESRIDTRNNRRSVGYKFMKPSEILNSISI